MRVLRDGPGDLSLRLPCLTRQRITSGKSVGPWGPLVCIYTMHLCLSVIYRPRHLTGSVVLKCFYFWSILYYYYVVYDLISNLIERLWWTWISMFIVVGHIWVWILLYFIILFYLAGLFEISECLKGFLLWPLVGTEKDKNSPLAPGWYREALICYYIHFVIYE
jgi:hypothetical protein